MDAVRANIFVDDGVVTAIPALSPLLGREIELIALKLKPQSGQQGKSLMSLDEFIATRQKWPAGQPPIALKEMDRAIAQVGLKSEGA